MVEPTTLTSPTICPPLRLTSCTANAVSAVSPDWLTATYSVSGSTIGFRYRNSDAGSASAGNPARSSILAAALWAPQHPLARGGLLDDLLAHVVPVAPEPHVLEIDVDRGRDLLGVLLLPAERAELRGAHRGQLAAVQVHARGGVRA